MHQILFRLGLRPRPRWGRLQRSPSTTSWKWAGLLLRGWEGEKGKRGERIEEEKERDGKKCSVPPPTFE